MVKVFQRIALKCSQADILQNDKSEMLTVNYVQHFNILHKKSFHLTSYSIQKFLHFFDALLHILIVLKVSKTRHYKMYYCKLPTYAIFGQVSMHDTAFGKRRFSSRSFQWENIETKHKNKSVSSNTCQINK